MKIAKGVVALVVACALWPTVGRADLVATGSAPALVFGHDTIIRFSATGVPWVGGLTSEELNSITRGPDGQLYVLENTLGYGRIFGSAAKDTGSSGSTRPHPRFRVTSHFHSESRSARPDTSMPAHRRSRQARASRLFSV